MENELKLLTLRIALQIIAVVGLIIYGVELARLGVDRIIAMLISVIVGGIAGYNFNKLYRVFYYLYTQSQRRDEDDDKYDQL